LSFATGPGFYSQKGKGTKEARFSFCTHNLTEIENGMKVLKKALEAYNNR
jgi:aspartate aminotransferase